jgi:hypothetical protein
MSMLLFVSSCLASGVDFCGLVLLVTVLVFCDGFVVFA